MFSIGVKYVHPLYLFTECACVWLGNQVKFSSKQGSELIRQHYILFSSFSSPAVHMHTCHNIPPTWTQLWLQANENGKFDNINSHQSLGPPKVNHKSPVSHEVEQNCPKSSSKDDQPIHLPWKLLILLHNLYSSKWYTPDSKFQIIGILVT